MSNNLIRKDGLPEQTWSNGTFETVVAISQNGMVPVAWSILEQLFKDAGWKRYS